METEGDPMLSGNEGKLFSVLSKEGGWRAGRGLDLQGDQLPLGDWEFVHSALSFCTGVWVDNTAVTGLFRYRQELTWEAFALAPHQSLKTRQIKIQSE